MNQKKWKKGIAVTISLLFLGTVSIPSIIGNQTNEINNGKIKEINENGIYILIYDQSAQDSEEAIPPYAYVSGYEPSLGGIGVSYYLYENIWDVNDEINKVIWWGFACNWDTGWIQGTPEGMNFKMEFYDDASDQTNVPPTDLVVSYDIHYEDLKLTHTGQYQFEVELVKFEYNFPTPVSISSGEGWISIWSYNDKEQDVFLWARSLQGDNFICQSSEETNTSVGIDVAFQLYEFELDETPPEVSIVQPKPSTIYLNNQELLQWPFITVIIGDFEILIDASDSVAGIDHVEIFINEDTKRTIEDEPYLWTWNESGFGSYKIKTVAYDKAGNSATTEELTVFKIF
jgi:hypothetical protein